MKTMTLAMNIAIHFARGRHITNSIQLHPVYHQCLVGGDTLGITAFVPYTERMVPVVYRVCI